MGQAEGVRRTPLPGAPDIGESAEICANLWIIPRAYAERPPRDAAGAPDTGTSAEICTNLWMKTGVCHTPLPDTAGGPDTGTSAEICTNLWIIPWACAERPYRAGR